MNAEVTSSGPCPSCGHPDALIALGVRYDHPYRWRPWVIRPTHLTLCDKCDALVALDEVRQPEQAARDRDMRRLLWHVIAGGERDCRLANQATGRHTIRGSRLGQPAVAPR